MTIGAGPFKAILVNGIGHAAEEIAFMLAQLRK